MKSEVGADFDRWSDNLHIISTDQDYNQQSSIRAETMCVTSKEDLS